jgi:hypothetical protein
MRSETTTSRFPKPPVTRLSELFHIVVHQLDELVDAWSELSDILAERAEIVGVAADDGLRTDLRDDENPNYLVADVVRTLESQLQRLRACEYRFNRSRQPKQRRSAARQPAR